MLSAAAALALAMVTVAGADPFSTRSGESGVLDVPTSDVLESSTLRFSGEIGNERVAGARDDVGPLPVSINAGVGRRMELGLFARGWSMPGDPYPTSTFFGAALKLGLTAPSGLLPGFAIDVVGDRLNERGNVSARLIASTQRLGPVKLAAIGGAMARPLSDLAATGGAALDVELGRRAGLALDALATPDGPKYGSALRFRVGSGVGLSVGADWLPQEDGVRFGVGFAVLAATPRQRRVSTAADGAQPVVPPLEPAREAPPEFLDDRPRFRLRIRPSPLDQQPGHGHQPGGAQPTSSGPVPPAPALAAGGAAAGRPQ